MPYFPSNNPANICAYCGQMGVGVFTIEAGDAALAEAAGVSVGGKVAEQPCCVPCARQRQAELDRLQITMNNFYTECVKDKQDIFVKEKVLLDSNKLLVAGVRELMHPKVKNSWSWVQSTKRSVFPSSN